MPRALTETEITDFRRRMCSVAERLFAERGLAAVTMRELAAELGVSSMTAYRYFRDKGDILAAVRASAFDRFAQALERAREDTASADRSTAIGTAYIDFALANPAAYKLMFDMSQPDAGDYPELAAAGRRARATLTAQIDDAIASGRAEGDAEEIGLMLWASVHGAVMLELAGVLPSGGARLLRQRADAVFRKGLRPGA
jgi:AcrR family transcriptional regulator